MNGRRGLSGQQVLRGGLFGAMAVLALLTGAGEGRAANPLEKNFWLSGPRYDAVLPGCESALTTIQERFATKEGRFWNSNLQIVSFERVHETAFRPWVENTVPRRFCSARALVSDGRWRPVYYSIIEDGGFISANDGVEWCVAGLDRNWAYNPGCRAAQP